MSLDQIATSGSASGQQGIGSDPSSYGQQNATLGLVQQGAGTGGVGLNITSPALAASRFAALNLVSTPLIASPSINLGQISLFGGSSLFTTIRP